MRKAGLLAVFLIFTPVILWSQASRKAEIDTRQWRYEVEGVGEGKDGTYLIKVWSYSKKPEVAIEQAKKNVIHGVIFRGFTGSGRVTSQPPLARDPGIEFSKKDFFDPFFKDGGNYMKYVSISGDGVVAAEDRLKVGKEYKIGVVVSVRKDQLKSDLVAAGVIRPLDSGF